MGVSGDGDRDFLLPAPVLAGIDVDLPLVFCPSGSALKPAGLVGKIDVELSHHNLKDEFSFRADRLEFFPPARSEFNIHPWKR